MRLPDSAVTGIVDGVVDGDIAFAIITGGSQRRCCLFAASIPFGEAGSDELEGDDGNDILSGGSGNDELEGDAGFDVLIVGLGADLLKGDSDGAILIGNRVTFENDPVALQFVLAEWTSNRIYTSRVANLRGTGYGTRLNGTTFLNASTVLNDNAIDTLMGSSGQDWFLGTIGQDLFSGRTANEQIN